MEFGTLGEWIGGIAAILGFFISLSALKSAREANKAVREADAEARKYNELVDYRETERDRRQVAGALQAWWTREIVDTENGSGVPVWGVMVSNSGAVPTVFYEVNLCVVANNIDRDVFLKVLPPGKFFIPNSELPKGVVFPAMVNPNYRYEAITASDKHYIKRLSFVDPLREAWTWTAETGLVSERTQNARASF